MLRVARFKALDFCLKLSIFFHNDLKSHELQLQVSNCNTVKQNQCYYFAMEQCFNLLRLYFAHF